MISHHMSSFIFFTDGEVCQQLAERVRGLRLARNWTQQELGARAGVSTPTVQRFERGDMITLGNFVRLIQALQRIRELESLLLPDEAISIEALEARLLKPKRQRARRRTKLPKI